MKKFKVFSLIFLFLISGVVYSQETEPNDIFDSLETSDLIIGVLFNANNILLDLDPYLDGVGLKLLYPDHSFRIMIGGGFQTGVLDVFKISSGFIYEKPIFKSIVSPYFGFSALVDFTLETSKTDEQNWIKTNNLLGGIGAIFGAEMFITEYLSCFAEYQLAGNVAWTRILNNVAGVKDAPVDALNYNISATIGNSGSIGITIYTRPASELSLISD